MPRQSFGIGWFREKYAHQEPPASVVPTGTVTETGSNLIGSVLDLQGAMSVLAAIEVAALAATSVEVVAEISLDQVNWYRVGGSKIEATGTTNVAHNTDAGRYLRFRAVVAGGTALATPAVTEHVAEGSGGTLATGTYRYKVTALDAAGETVGSAEVSQAVVLGEKVKLVWGAVSSATSYRVYRSPVNGAVGSENVYIAVPSGHELVDSGAAGTAGTPPAAGTSGADAVLGINVQTVRDRKPGGVNNE